jgi:propanol-preferring alcohol dehydrogenase
MLDMVATHDIGVKTNPFHGLEKLPELIELVHSGRLKGKGIITVDEEAMKTDRETTKKLV